MRPPRPQREEIAGALVGTAIGVALIVDNQKPLGAFFIVGPIVLIALAPTMRDRVNRQRSADNGRRLTGRVLTPAAGLPPVWWAPWGWTWTWSGGADVPSTTGFGRRGVTTPFAKLQLAGPWLTLRIHARFVSATFDGEWLASDVTRIHPVRGFIPLARGLAIITADGQLIYFWTPTPEPLLTALQQQGFRVDWNERDVPSIRTGFSA